MLLQKFDRFMWNSSVNTPFLVPIENGHFKPYLKPVDWGGVSQGIMIIAGISFLDPLLYDSAYSLKRREQIGAKDVLLINEDKNFGMIILSWFPQFKQHQLNFMSFYPFRHGLRN